MAAHYRGMDELSAVAYRGLSLGISFAPLLFFVPTDAFLAVPEQLPFLLLAALIAGVANIFAALSIRVLVIRVANTVGFSTVAFVSALIDAFYYGKFLSLQQVSIIVLIFVALFFFSKGDSKHQSVREGSLAKGVFFSVAFGALIAIALAMVGELAKGSHPFLVGYCWELLIGICVLSFGCGRAVVFGRGIQRVSWKTFWSILVASAPTALGTGLFMYALSTGQLALASALLSTTMVFSLLFGAYMYKESFGKREGVLLAIITLLICALKVISGQDPVLL